MKESTVAFQLRIKESTHRKLRAISSTELRSLNNQIEYFLLKGIADYEAANGPVELPSEESE